MPQMRLLMLLFLCLCVAVTSAQDTTQVDIHAGAIETPKTTTAFPDSTTQKAIFQRPFILSSGNTSMGGYLEANASHSIEDGVGNGLQMEMPRFNVFLFSNISSRVRFLAEIEFEHGTEEINIETALIDFDLHPALVVRAGIILLPIGAFNVRHDSPLYEFIRRPLVSTEIIPATFSSVGGGLYGSVARNKVVFTYDVYLSNGLDAGVIFNDEGRTLTRGGKSAALFGEEGSGLPALSGRLAVRYRGLGELGVSGYRGAYNIDELEGVVIDERRWLSILAIDLSASVGPVALRSEAALNLIDLPNNASEAFGSRQNGIYAEAVVPITSFAFLDYTDIVLHAGLRFDHIDYNVGRFNSTGADVGDDITAATASLSLRPTPSTVIMFNFRRQWQHDVLGNEAVNTATYALGFASYF